MISAFHGPWEIRIYRSGCKAGPRRKCTNLTREENCVGWALSGRSKDALFSCYLPSGPAWYHLGIRIDLWCNSNYMHACQCWVVFSSFQISLCVFVTLHMHNRFGWSLEGNEVLNFSLLQFILWFVILVMLCNACWLRNSWIGSVLATFSRIILLSRLINLYL